MAILLSISGVVTSRIEMSDFSHLRLKEETKPIIFKKESLSTCNHTADGSIEDSPLVSFQRAVAKQHLLSTLQMKTCYDIFQRNWQ